MMMRRSMVVLLLAAILVPGICSVSILKAATSRRTPNMNVADTNTVLLPNRSPLVTFRILLMTGSAYDPKGKEGLASLTAPRLAEGGPRTKPYSQITDSTHPTATSVHWPG